MSSTFEYFKYSDSKSHPARAQENALSVDWKIVKLSPGDLPSYNAADVVTG